jgi:hypothetical protein
MICQVCETEIKKGEKYYLVLDNEVCESCKNEAVKERTCGE